MVGYDLELCTGLELIVAQNPGVAAEIGQVGAFIGC